MDTTFYNLNLVRICKGIKYRNRPIEVEVMTEFEVVVDVMPVGELIVAVEVPLNFVLVMIILVLVELVVVNTETRIECVILSYQKSQT